MRLVSLCLALALLAPTVLAQELERPVDWQVRFDRPNTPDSALYFVTMTPGWHITTGPAGILYDPSRTARGQYRVQAEIFLFPVERREAFGVFIGGRNLTEENQSYTYFLIRKDGRYLVKHRSGRRTSVIVPWTEHAAIVKHEGGEEPVKNVLAIHAGADEVDFYVNGEKVSSIPRSEVDTDGIVGLRVNHRLNLHVSELTVEQRGTD